MLYPVKTILTFSLNIIFTCTFTIFSIRKVPLDVDTDFTDRGYQSKLPMHARSTATQAVKNNLRITEIQADSSLILNSQKVT